MSASGKTCSRAALRRSVRIRKNQRNVEESHESKEQKPPAPVSHALKTIGLEVMNPDETSHGEVAVADEEPVPEVTSEVPPQVPDSKNDTSFKRPEVMQTGTTESKEPIPGCSRVLRSRSNSINISSVPLEPEAPESISDGTELQNPIGIDEGSFFGSAMSASGKTCSRAALRRSDRIRKYQRNVEESLESKEQKPPAPASHALKTIGLEVTNPDETSHGEVADEEPVPEVTSEVPPQVPDSKNDTSFKRSEVMQTGTTESKESIPGCSRVLRSRSNSINIPSVPLEPEAPESISDGTELQNPMVLETTGASESGEQVQVGKSHKPDCDYTESEFHSRFFVLWKPKRLEETLERENKELKTQHGGKTPAEIVNNPMVVKYLKEQRELMESIKPDFFQQCKCFPDEENESRPEVRKNKLRKRTRNNHKKSEFAVDEIELETEVTSQDDVMKVLENETGPSSGVDGPYLSEEEDEAVPVHNPLHNTSIVDYSDSDHEENLEEAVGTNTSTDAKEMIAAVLTGDINKTGTCTEAETNEVISAEASDLSMPYVADHLSGVMMEEKEAVDPSVPGAVGGPLSHDRDILVAPLDWVIDRVLRGGAVLRFRNPTFVPVTTMDNTAGSIIRLESMNVLETSETEPLIHLTAAELIMRGEFLEPGGCSSAEPIVSLVSMSVDLPDDRAISTSPVPSEPDQESISDGTELQNPMILETKRASESGEQVQVGRSHQLHVQENQKFNEGVGESNVIGHERVEIQSSIPEQVDIVQLGDQVCLGSEAVDESLHDMDVSSGSEMNIGSIGKEDGIVEDVPQAVNIYEANVGPIIIDDLIVSESESDDGIKYLGFRNLEEDNRKYREIKFQMPENLDED